jgi:hypothetical protein
MEWLKVWALSLNPSTTKKIKEKNSTPYLLKTTSMLKSPEG